jgi:cation transport protein ChaC
MQDNSSHWVFGYGSLIWRPGFASMSQQQATMPGVHRRLCVYSYRHRGTERQPGLVFGLVRGGSCRGMAFEVHPAEWAEVHAYLSEREMDRGVYREALRPMRLADGRRVKGLAFLVDDKHAQFAGRLTAAEQARLVRMGVGESGPNPEYVLETARHLLARGIRDRGIDEVVAALRVDLPVAGTA